MGIPAKTIGPELGFNEFGRTLVKNVSGVAISKGDILLVNGATTDATNALFTVTKASAATAAGGGGFTKLKVAAQDIAIGGVGEAVDWLWFEPSYAIGGASAQDPIYLADAAGTTSLATGTVTRQIGWVLDPTLSMILLDVRWLA